MKVLDENGFERDAYITDDEVIFIYDYVANQLGRDVSNEEAKVLGYAVRGYDEVLHKRRAN